MLARTSVENGLHHAIVDYLEEVSRRHRDDESLEVAIACVRESFGLVGRAVPVALRLEPSSASLATLGSATAATSAA